MIDDKFNGNLKSLVILELARDTKCTSSIQMGTFLFKQTF